MIGYVTLGTNDLPRAAKFYDAIAEALGVKRMMETDTFIAWGEPAGEAAGIGITKPFDGEAASVGNGVMVALAADSRQQVDRIHAIALTQGGADEGAPGHRADGDAGDMQFYAAYFRDLDGNKLNVFTYGPGEAPA